MCYTICMSNTQEIISYIQKQSIGSIVSYDSFEKDIRNIRIPRNSLRKTVSRVVQKGMIERMNCGEFKVLSNTSIKIFVYGSLKRRCSNHTLLKENATFLGTATTIKRFAMYKARYGNFPRLIETKSKYAKQICGEIYEIYNPSFLEKLDHFEGLEYERVKIKVKTSTDRIKIVEAYVNHYGQLPDDVEFLEKWEERKITIDKNKIINSLYAKISIERRLDGVS